MSQTLTSKITLLLDSLYQNTVGIAQVNATIARASAFPLASGTGLNQSDRVYSETITLAASATVTKDLAGSLVDIFGAVITFVKIKAIIVLPLAANTNNVIMGAAAATQFVGPLGSVTDTISTRPGGMTCLVAPDATAWAVGAGATDFLKFANSAAGTSVTFDLVLLGTSA